MSSHAVAGCPGDLDATGKARWNLVRDDMGADWNDVYAATTTRYVNFLTAMDEALDDLHTVPASVGPDGTSSTASYRTTRLQLTTLGSQGQMVQHPSWKTYTEAARGAAEAAEALRLTPRARQKAGESKPPPAGGRLSGRL